MYCLLATKGDALYRCVFIIGNSLYAHLAVPQELKQPVMLQDIRAGKQTEIDALNGAVVSLGKQHVVPTPANITVTRMIQFMESRPNK